MSKSRRELDKKGYMEGRYKTGQGHAHECCNSHTKIFNCKMFGTFNVWLVYGNLFDFKPSIVTKIRSYWFLSIRRRKKIYYGWAIRDHNSNQASKCLEILTKELLPDNLKQESFAVNIYEKWSDELIKAWAKDMYWFQTFSFSPKMRADSKFIWDTINRIDWSAQTVLDIGAHYGFFSFEASKVGAQVIGIEPNNNSFKFAKLIRDNIIHQDVTFESWKFKVDTIPEKSDIILYLSVHHQIDPNYIHLKKTIQILKRQARKHLFVELILPPMFPKKGGITEEDIDKIVGGQILTRYKHNVRGDRKIYWIKND